MSSGGYISAHAQQPYTKWDADRDEIEVDYQQMTKGQGQNCFSGRKGCFLKLLLAIVIFFIGLILGYVMRRSVHEALFTKKCGSEDTVHDYSREISVVVRTEIEAKYINESLIHLSKEIHLTGTSVNNQLGSWLKAQLIQYSIPYVKEAKYTALLSYADYENPNEITLVAQNGSVVYTYNYTNPHYENNHPDMLPYNAYAAHGKVKGLPVYANYGRKEDFDALKSMNISCQGKIIIIRYGKIYQGNQVKRAEECGAAGVVLYPDPADFASSAHTQYPASKWLPGWAVVRGSVLTPAAGDPLSPGIPSVAGIYRLPQSSANLPKIPVQPLGYDAASHMLSNLKGSFPEVLKQAWKGGLNISYGTGPGYLPPRSDLLVQLDVKNEREDRLINNIIGMIPGDEEPDRYVIVGCHYDAWSKGTGDPNSGTAMLLEIARAFGKLAQKGWLPRRTIVFIHWDGEEQALVGSYEWIEDHYPELFAGAVAYINLDTSIRGNFTLGGQGSAEVQSVFWNASQMVLCTEPECGDHTLYDQWQQRNIGKQPKLHAPGMGSDHQTFMYLAGIPIIFPSFLPDRRKSMPFVPTYHTMLDNMDVLSRFVDPGLHAHVGLSRVVVDCILRLADSAKLPISSQGLADTLIQEMVKIDTPTNQKLLDDNGVTLDYLKWGIGNFSLAADLFDQDFQGLHTNQILAVRRMNDKLLQMSRSFINYGGLGRSEIRNLLMSPSITDAADHKYFTRLRDLIDARRWEQVKVEVSLVTVALRRAKHILSDHGLLRN